jgi:hypothetical protein
VVQAGFKSDTPKTCQSLPPGSFPASLTRKMISLVAPKRNEVIEHCQMFQARRDGLVNPAAQRVLDAEARDLDYTYDPPAHHYAPDRLLRLPKDRDFKVIGVVNQRLKPVPQITVTITSGETSGVFHQHIYGYDCMGGVFIWPNHDPINEIGFQTLNRSRRSFDRNQEKNLYDFVANDPIKNVDLYGLACGFFVVSPKQVPIYGSDADKRGVSPGTPVDGFSVRFVPDKNCCTCAKNDIHLMQTISFKPNYIPGWSDPTFDEQTGSGNLGITDAPWSGWLFGTAFKLKDCAYCSDGKALGCVSFTWAYDSFNSNPTLSSSGPSQAQDP